MKKLLILIILVFLVILVILLSCGSKSGHRLDNRDTVASYTVEDAVTKVKYIQVMHFDGYVENLKDHVGLQPKTGDTIVIVDSWYMLHDSSTWDDRRIYGKYTKDTPRDWATDSSYCNYTPVIVLKE